MTQPNPTPRACCREYEQAAGLVAVAASSPACAAASAAAVATTHVRRRLPADRVRGRTTGGNVLVVLSPARGHRRPRHGRAARRPGVLQGPPDDRRTQGQPRWSHRPDVRAAPADGAAAVAVGLRRARRRARASVSPVPNRSHFSAMEEVEDADPGSSVRRGLDQPDDRPRTNGDDPSEAVQLGTSIVPTGALPAPRPRSRRADRPTSRWSVPTANVGGSAAAPSSTGCGRGRARPRWPVPTPRPPAPSTCSRRPPPRTTCRPPA